MLHYSEILKPSKTLLLVLILFSIVELSFLNLVIAKSNEVPLASPPEDTDDVGKWICQNFPKFCQDQPTPQPTSQPTPQASHEKENNGESADGKGPVKSHDK